MVGSLASEYKAQPNATGARLKHIPGRTGLPLIGLIPSLYRDFYGTIQNHYERYGLTSKIRMGPQTGILVLGPDNAQTILLDKEKNFSSQMGYAEVFQPWFGNPLLLRDFDEHRLHRRLYQTAFKAEAMQRYAEHINQIVGTALNDWDHKTELLFMPFMKQLLIKVSARIFYGVEDMGEDAKHFMQAFLDIFDKGMMAIVKQEIPPLKYYYGKQGKRFVRGYLQSLIEPRRQQPGDDFMSFFVQEVDDEGKLFTNEELLDHLSFLFFAAYDTTSNTLNHLVMHLAADQALQDKLRQQSLELGTAVADYSQLKHLTEIEKAFNEAMRLYPSVPVFMRRNIKPCEFDGVEIPANSILQLVPGFNHRMPEYWSEPERFDPERFNQQRQEHKRHNYAFIPFGGGAHKCIGMHLALLNGKLFMHQLLQRYRFRLQPGYTIKSQTIPTPQPMAGLPLIIEPLRS